MDWDKLFKKGKELSSLQLEKTDVTYQVWELGRVCARISEVSWRMKVSLDEGNGGEDISDLIKRNENLFISLQSLYKRLSTDPIRILGNVEDLNNRIEHLYKEVKESPKTSRWDYIHQEIEWLRNLIVSELRSVSVHLCNIFSFSLGLRDLKARLIYNFNLSDIKKLIEDNIEVLEKLEKGDKVLASPNLEITPQNLKIIKIRMNGFREHLSELEKYAQINKTEFKKRVEDRCNIWTDLILDIKNPSDYLTRTKRVLNKIIPTIVCYYMIVIPIVIVATSKKSVQLSGIDTGVVVTLVLGFVPLLIAFYRWVYARTKNWLIVLSFKFDISKFKVESL